jgi:hypothetical protein
LDFKRLFVPVFDTNNEYSIFVQRYFERELSELYADHRVTSAAQKAKLYVNSVHEGMYDRFSNRQLNSVARILIRPQQFV